MKTNKSINEKLREAAHTGSAGEVERCLSRADCDPLARGSYECSALMWAALNGHESCVKLLLPRSDPLARSEDGWSALMHAAKHGHEKCVKLLLPHSDPLAKSRKGLTASRMASDNGYPALAEMIDAYVLARSEAHLLAKHVPSGPTQNSQRRVASPRI